MPETNKEVNVMHPDSEPYHRFTRKGRISKSLQSIAGIIEGLVGDQKITRREIDFINMWLDDHEDVVNRHPFNEIIPTLKEVFADGIITTEERDDIIWLCNRLTSDQNYHNTVTLDIQRLHGLLGGIIADAVITKDELGYLQNWLLDHEHLRSCWPYDEIDSLITGIMADHVIDEDEHSQLLTFFADFTEIGDDRVIGTSVVKDGHHIGGLCAVCPDIVFSGSLFCFSGLSSRYRRTELESIVESRGGIAWPRVTKELKYLVVGAEGNPAWAYACYGRKIEQTVMLRKKGYPIVIVHENDFHDAV